MVHSFKRVLAGAHFFNHLNFLQPGCVNTFSNINRVYIEIVQSFIHKKHKELDHQCRSLQKGNCSNLSLEKMCQYIKCSVKYLESQECKEGI